MSYGHSDEQELLKEQLQHLLADRATPESLRRLIDDGAAWDRALWTEMAELGFLGAGIDEHHGGAGFGPGGVAVIMEEIGRRVAPLPYFASLCVAAEAIGLAGSEDQKQRWLPQLASGQIVGTFALNDAAVLRSPGQPAAHVSEGRLSGSCGPVPDAAIADICVIMIGSGQLAVVELKQLGVSMRPLTGFDELRQHAVLDFAEAAAELLEEGPDDPVAALLDRAAVYQAFEQVGGAEAALLMARDYAKQRYIFGRTLASYQATKHKLAELLIELELARSLALHALNALVGDDPHLARAAAAARLAATRAYEDAARENLQVHGGIGFTWEANVHFHLRRARLLALDLGPAEAWADRLVDDLSRNPALAQAA